MAPRASNSNWVDWKKCRGRRILLKDLESGELPLDDDVVSAAEAWDHYSQLDEFVGVPQDQFTERLKGHRDQVRKQQSHIQLQLDALQNDRTLHPANLYDRRGNRVFYYTDAKKKLEEDVADEKHLQMSVNQLFDSREEYLQWRTMDSAGIQKAP